MPFADELIGVDTAQALRDVIADAAAGADLSLLAAASGRFNDLPLRERSDLLRDGLLAGLPQDYDAFAAVIRRAAVDDRLTGWMIWPVTSAVALRADEDGSDAAFADGMALLAELTGRLTAEFAIRTPLRRDLDRGLSIALSWTTSPDEHVRRLASEGTRPYLPWAVRVPALITHPRATVPILDALYRDESEYVRRSVANHLNDISRHTPHVVVETAARWLEAPDANTAWVIRHGLRTLVKQGDPGALALLGFGEATVTVDGPTLEGTSVAVGQSVRFRADVRNDGAAGVRIAVDYLVHHTKANGTQTSKTFKLTTATLAPGERLPIDREHSFKVITTRRYHPGPHAIELQVNGVRHGRVDFDLTAG